MQAYCVKDRKKVEIKNPKAITMKNGRPATQGVCPICGTKVFRIGKGQFFADVALEYRGAGYSQFGNFQPLFYSPKVTK